ETEASLEPNVIADKFVLAVKDRNIRMLFLNTKAARNTEKGYMDDYLDSIIESLSGPQGAIERIEKAGYQIGEAHAFVEHGKTLNGLKLVLLAGGTALIALTIGYFVRSLVTVIFIIGILGVFALYGLSSSIALQAMALGVGICAPTWSTLYAIRSIEQFRNRGQASSVWKAIGIFLRTTILTLIGIAYVVGLLTGLSYYLVLEQFRGVTLLHMVPIVLVGIYVLLFRE